MTDMADMKVDVKHCVSCGVDKPETEFSQKRPNQFQSKCKACQRIYSQEWYEKNRAKVAPKIAARKAAMQPALLALVEKHVATTPCSACGKKRSPFVDLFVNGVRRTPKQLAYAGYSKESLQAALAQTTVVCSPCRYAAAQLARQEEQARFEAEQAAKPPWRRYFQEVDLLDALDPPWEEHPTRVPLHSYWAGYRGDDLVHSVRENAVFWMPRTGSIQSYRRLLHPGSFEEGFITKGLLATCGALWAARGDLDKLMAAWILALAIELGSSRTHQTWPLKAWDALRELREWAADFLDEENTPYWHHAMTCVLPGDGRLLSRLVPPEDDYGVLLVIRDLATMARGSGQYIRLTQQEG